MASYSRSTSETCIRRRRPRSFATASVVVCSLKSATCRISTLLSVSEFNLSISWQIEVNETSSPCQFVTFVDAAAAAAFFQLATFQGLMLNSRRLKVGWGKHSGALHPATAAAVQAGASRNIYVGGITDFETYSEERLRRDFSEYGE
jgi:hypothetical protein